MPSRFEMPEIDPKLRKIGIMGPDLRRMGKGAKLAAVREHEHREKQAARVAPAIYVLGGSRWLISDNRQERWIRKGRSLDKAPRHIQEMAREVGMRA